MFGKSNREPVLYTAGPLTYTRGRLFLTMGLIILGVFIYAVSVMFVPKIIPLRLKELGCSNTLLIFIMSTFSQVLNMTVCPWVSFKSDRFRSKRWGRRFPFIFYTMPMMCAAWLLFAFVDTESALLQKAIAPLITLAPATVTIILLAMIVIIYQFFFMFVGSVIYYIYNDLIPPQFMTRFMGVIQILSSLAAAFFNFFIFEHSLTNFRWILIGITIAYAIGMSIMCLFVKEPRFPEPDAEEKRQSKGIRAMLTFMKESFSHRFYWYAFCGNAAVAVAGATAVFSVFYQKNMGMDLSQIGKLNGWTGLIGTGLVFAIALIGTPFIDRWHPVRISVFCLLFGQMGTVLDCKWIFFSPPVEVFFWGSLMITQVTFLIRFRGISQMPALMRLYPKSRFGQFCSAGSMFRSLMVLFFSLLLGVFMDFLKEKLQLGDYAYRFIYVWVLFFNCIGIFCYIMMYREFLRLGGYNGYKAPAPWAPGGLEPMPVTECSNPHKLAVKISVWGMTLSVGLLLLWSIFMYFTARNAQASVAANHYLLRCVPLAAVLLAGYLFMSKLAINARKLPHHGMLVLSAIMTALLTVSFAVENFLAFKMNKGALAPGMLLYELITLAILLGMLFFYLALERKSNKNIAAAQ